LQDNFFGGQPANLTEDGIDATIETFFALTSEHLNKREPIIWTPKYRNSLVHAITEPFKLTTLAQVAS